MNRGRPGGGPDSLGGNMDSVIKSELHWSEHDETMTHVTSQPSENLILAWNKAVRDNSLMGDLSFGRHLAAIPEIAWEAGIRAGYDMANPDGRIAGREIHRFLNTPYGRQCLLHESKPKYFQGGF